MVFADMNILIMHYRNVVNFGRSLYLYPQFIIISTVSYVIAWSIEGHRKPWCIHYNDTVSNKNAAHSKLPHHYLQYGLACDNWTDAMYLLIMAGLAAITLQGLTEHNDQEIKL